MDIVVERSGALDVHKAQVTACGRVPDGSKGQRVEEVETFATTVAGLLALADWLDVHGVSRVAMDGVPPFSWTSERLALASR